MIKEGTQSISDVQVIEYIALCEVSVTGICDTSYHILKLKATTRGSTLGALNTCTNRAILDVSERGNTNSIINNGRIGKIEATMTTLQWIRDSYHP